MARQDREPPKTRLTRTRTGCLKCRVRRRKCDEGKPNCQRCKDGGFECQYGTKLSFLDKNSFTVAAPAQETQTSYSAVRFVDRPSSSPRETKSATTGSVDLGSPQEQKIKAHEASDLTPSEQLPDVYGVASTPLPHPPSLAAIDVHRSAEDYGVNIEISPSHDAYEAALDVLVSLGNEPGAIPQSSPATVATDNSHVTKVLPPPTVQQCAKLFPNTSHVTQDDTIQLVRHYRYNIAPLLDIGDPDQTFGIDICRTAFASRPNLLNAILELSLSTLEGSAATVIGWEDWTLELPGLHHPAEEVAVHALTAARLCTVTEPLSWQSPINKVGLSMLNSVFPQEHQACWVLFRIDIAVGLINNTAVSIPSFITTDTSSPASFTLDKRIYSREPIRLCAQVLNHCFEPQPGSVQIWRDLFHALNAWFDTRGQQLKPMVDFDEENQLFPLILFTNSAAILANQMYHTAMLLLLQHRPRTVGKELGRGSMVMSPLWHAQRICGISLNNDDRNSWDFSSVAALYVAARGMSYAPQQEAISNAFARIGDLTKWKLGSLQGELHRLWQPTQGL